MENKIRILALFGKSGAGKDTIQKCLVETGENLHGIVSYTTRLPRENERDGLDYYFVSDDEFNRMRKKGDLLESSLFNSWQYGTSINSLDPDKVNIGVFNIEGIKSLLQDTRLEVLPVYIRCTDKTRLLRTLSREVYPDCCEICRRFLADELDFDPKNINFDFVEYENEYEGDAYSSIVLYSHKSIYNFIMGVND